ncbi:transglutaminase family protein [Cellulomonas sp. URHB0016]
MTARARIPRGPRATVATGLCGVATGASLLALTGLIDGTTWLVRAWVAIVLVAAVCAGVRSVTRSWWAPTLAGLLVSVAGLVVRYGAPPGRIQVLPDVGALERTMATAREGFTVINQSLVPMPGIRPAELLVVTGALAVLLVSDLVAVGLGSPAWAGLVLVTLWFPAVVLGFPASPWALAWSGLAYLLLLALSAAPAAAHSDGGRRVGTAVVCAAAVVVATLVAGPVVAALPGWASLSLPDFGTGPVGPLQLSDSLDLRESLGTRSGQVVLRYTVEGADGVEPSLAPAPDEPSPSASADPVETVTARLVGPLRAFTLTSFDGQSWQRDDGDTSTAWDRDELLTSDRTIRGSAPDASRGTLATVQIEVGSLRERHLPVSTFPRTVDVGGAWGYDELRDEVVGQRSTFDGMHYAMVVQVPALTADELADEEIGDPGDDGASLTVPTTSHSDDIAALARELTQDATTPYEQAMDLQSYFRADTNFAYDTRVAPARSTDAVWDFLRSRRGYCVQFATSMAVLARTLGIPARVGVGFLPGDNDGDGQYVVTGRKSHAWPELYFEGSGWVRFEPTPAVQTGAPPIWSDPFTAISQPGSQPSEAVPSGVAPSVAATQQGGAPATSAPQSTDNDWVTVGVVAGFVLIAGILGLTVARRRTRTRADLTPERAWLRARRGLANRGLTWTDSTTPRGAVITVQDQLRTVSGAALSGPPEAALVSLARTVEHERYAREPIDFDPDQLDQWVVELVGGVEAHLKERPAAAGEPAGTDAASRTT